MCCRIVWLTLEAISSPFLMWSMSGILTKKLYKIVPLKSYTWATTTLFRLLWWWMCSMHSTCSTWELWCASHRGRKWRPRCKRGRSKRRATCRQCWSKTWPSSTPMQFALAMSCPSSPRTLFWLKMPSVRRYVVHRLKTRLTEGNTDLGWSSPALPAFTECEPRSSTIVDTSSRQSISKIISGTPL